MEKAPDINFRVREPVDPDVPCYRPSTIYYDEFLRLRCALDLILLKIYPDSKEITEAMAAWRVFREQVLYPRRDGHDPGDVKKMKILVVGDGVTPRAGALFTLVLKENQVISVDPKFKKTAYPEIRGLTCLKKKIAEIEPVEADEVAIINVHSHAPFEDIFGRILARRIFLIHIPCCFQGDPPLDGLRVVRGASFIDWGIWSCHRHVFFWELARVG